MTSATTLRSPTLAELPPPPPGKAGWPWTVETPQPAAMRADGSAWPPISIVTPSYNQGQFIEETIRSVILQGYPNLEYIMIDGGSNDETVEIIRKYEAWLTCWVSEPDRGQAHAINKGFAKANGKVLNWLCSDDIFLPGAFHTVANSIGDNAWLIGSARPMSENGSFVAEVRHSRYRRGDVVYNGYILNQVSVFWLRAMYEKIGGVEEDLYYTMDGRLWMHFEMLAKPAITLAPLGAFRAHPGQKTARWESAILEFDSIRRRASKGRLARLIISRFGWQIRKAAARLRLSDGVGFRVESISGENRHGGPAP